MTVWPIYASPMRHRRNPSIRVNSSSITSTVLELLNTSFPAQPVFTAAQLGEQILVPPAMQQNKPVHVRRDPAARIPPAGSPIVIDVATAPATTGQLVTNLSPNTVSQPNSTIATADDLAVLKSRLPVLDVVAGPYRRTPATSRRRKRRRLQTIYGFSCITPRVVKPISSKWSMRILSCRISYPSPLRTRLTIRTTCASFFSTR